MSPRDLTARRRRRLLALALTVLSVLGALAAYVALARVPRYPVPKGERSIAQTPSQIARGATIFDTRCADCHVDPGTGIASGRRIHGIPPWLATSDSANITRDLEAGLGAWSNMEIAHALRTGVARDGRVLPPWMPRLPRMSDEDLDCLLAFLRSGDPRLRPSARPSGGTTLTLLGKALALAAFRPDSAPTATVVAPPRSDPVAYGKYVVDGLAECWSCHSGDFADLDRTDPPRTEGYLAGGTILYDARGEIVVSPNITPDLETGIGAWSDEELLRALGEGLRPDGTRLRSPMPRYDGLTEAELRSIVAYLRSVPPRPRVLPR